MKFRTYIYRFAVAFIFLIVNTWTWAQPPGGPPPGGGGGEDPPCWQPPCIPIDSGIIFLIIAGVLLGVGLLYRNRLAQQ